MLPIFFFIFILTSYTKSHQRLGVKAISKYSYWLKLFFKHFLLVYCLQSEEDVFVWRLWMYTLSLGYTITSKKLKMNAVQLISCCFCNIPPPILSSKRKENHRYWSSSFLAVCIDCICLNQKRPQINILPVSEAVVNFMT